MHLHHNDLSRLTSANRGRRERGENVSSFGLPLPSTAEKYMWRAVKTKDGSKGSAVLKDPLPYVVPSSDNVDPVFMFRVCTLI